MVLLLWLPGSEQGGRDALGFGSGKRWIMFSKKTQILIVRIIAVLLVIAMVGTLLAALM